MRSHLPHRKDANHREIAQAFERLGCFVFDTSAVGGGYPDIVAATGEDVLMVEIKTPKGKLTNQQIDFIRRWPGTIHIISTVEQVAELVRKTLKERAA